MTLAPPPQLTVPEPRWTTLRADAWIIRRYGHQTILFNPLSADTHRLDELAMELLDLVRHTPAHLEELFVLMGADDDASRAMVARLLRELDHLGLIAPSP